MTTVDSQKQEIGLRLLQERTRLGLTQAEMAKRGNVGFSTYTAYEKGKSTPDAVALQNWSDCGVDVLYVVIGQATNGKLAPDELMLLGAWRDSPDEVRAGILGFYRAYGSAIRREEI